MSRAAREEPQSPRCGHEDGRCGSPAAEDRPEYGGRSLQPPRKTAPRARTRVFPEPVSAPLVMSVALPSSSVTEECRTGSDTAPEAPAQDNVSSFHYGAESLGETDGVSFDQTHDL